MYLSTRSRSPRRAAAGEPEGLDLKDSAYFSQAVKIHYFCSGPISVDPMCPQPKDAEAYLGACGLAAAGLPLLGVKFGKTEIKAVKDNMRYISLYFEAI